MPIAIWKCIILNISRSSNGLGRHPLKVEIRVRISVGIPLLYYLPSTMIKLSGSNAGLVFYAQFDDVSDIGYQGGTSDLIINHNAGKLVTRFEALASSDGIVWSQVSDRGNYYAAGNFKFGIRLINLNTSSCNLRRGALNEGGEVGATFDMRVWLYSSE